MGQAHPGSRQAVERECLPEGQGLALRVWIGLNPVEEGQLFEIVLDGKVFPPMPLEPFDLPLLHRSRPPRRYHLLPPHL